MLDRMGISGTKAGNAILKGYDLIFNGANRVRQGIESLKQRIESTTVGSKLISGFDAVLNKVRQVGSTISSSLSKGLDTAKSKVDSLNNSMGTLGQGVTSVFGAIGLGSVYQATIGLAMVREQMTTLMTATMGSSSAAKDFVGSLDNLTNSSLVSLNDLGKAMANIKMSTGMTNEQLKLIAPTVNDIGQRALLMGMDTGQAQDLMTASFRGLNGEFDMLKTNFGITKQSLVDAGWSGASTDVAGYNSALQTVLARGGDMNGMLASTPGQIKLVEKGFTTAGRQIGETFLPAIKLVLGFMVQLKATNPIVFKIIIVIGALISAFAMLMPVMGFMIGSFKSLLMFLKLIPVAENATTISTVRATAARWLNAAASTASAAALWVYNAAQTAYNFITGGSVGVTVASTASRIAHGIASGAAAIATGALTAAQWALNLAMSMNPVMIVVIAIIALIAILAYLYNKNETVRNAINGLWNGLKSLGSYIMGGLMAAWTALTTALQPISDALGRLWAAISKVWNAFAGGQSAKANSTFTQISGAVHSLWTIISALVGIVTSKLTPVWNALLPVLMAVANIITGFLGAALSTLFGILSAVIGFIARFINILADLISGNITFGQAMSQVWNSLWVMLGGILASIINGIGGFILGLALQGIAAGMAFVTNLVTWIQTLPMQVAFWLGFVIGRIIAWAIALNLYARNAAIGFVLAVVNFFMTMPGKVWVWLVNTINKIIAWKNSAIAHARQTGSNFITAVVSFIQTLPSRVWSFLMSTISKIISFASSAGSKARTAGSNVVNGIKNTISSLPSLMWDELMNVGHAITSAGGELYNYAKDIGNKIVDGIKAGAGIHSPGYAYHAINDEMTLLGEALDNAKSNLTTKAKDVGSSISEGFTSTLKTPTVPNMPVATQTTAQPTAVTANGPNTAGPSITPTVDVPALTAQTTQANTIVAGSVGFVSGQYNLLKSNTGTSWTAMISTQKNSLSTMKSNMNDTLTKIVASNKTGYSDIQKTTSSTLDNLKTKTKGDMGAVTSSWNGMKSGLISAANNIKSDVGSDISKLSSNIGTFYRRIRNPGLFLAGPGPRNGRYAGSPRIGRSGGKFAGSSKTGSNGIDLLNSVPNMLCTEKDGCYAGWDSFRPNEPDIMGPVDGYIPSFGSWGSLGLNVGDFEKSANPLLGNMGAFEQIAAKLIDATSYQFYYNSKGGSPADIYGSGSFNCWDGALIMLQLARNFGLSGYMAHGMWGDFGHVWAVINGVNMDTTARQDGYGWTSPKVRGYAGSPSLKSFGQQQPTTTDPEGGTLYVQETLDFNLNLKIEGLKEGMSEAEIIAILTEVITDSELVKKLVKDRGFQDRLDKAIEANKKRKGRVSGT